MQFHACILFMSSSMYIDSLLRHTAGLHAVLVFVSSSSFVIQSIGLIASQFTIHSVLPKIPQTSFLCMVCTSLGKQRPCVSVYFTTCFPNKYTMILEQKVRDIGHFISFVVFWESSKAGRYVVIECCAHSAKRHLNCHKTGANLHTKSHMSVQDSTDNNYCLIFN